MIPHLLSEGLERTGQDFRLAWDEDERVVAFVWFGLLPGMPESSRFLFDVYVLPEARRQGVGREVLETMMESKPRALPRSCSTCWATMSEPLLSTSARDLRLPAEAKIGMLRRRSSCSSPSNGSRRGCRVKCPSKGASILCLVTAAISFGSILRRWAKAFLGE